MHAWQGKPATPCGRKTAGDDPCRHSRVTVHQSPVAEARLDTETASVGQLARQIPGGVLSLREPCDLPMKIVYLHQYFRTPAMSGGTRSYEMARRLVAKGHQVEMITSDTSPTSAAAGPGWRETVEDGIRVHWYPVPYSNQMNFASRIASFCKFAVASMQRAASVPCDVIFATSTPLTIAFPGLYARWRQQAPLVFEVRDLWPEVPIAMGAIRNPLMIAAARWLERHTYRSSAEIVALSPQMADGVRNCGIADDKIHMIPNSCDFELFEGSEERGVRFRQEREWLQDRPLVVYTGTLGAANGVDYFVRLAAAVGQIDPEIRFLIVGEGKMEPQIRELARQTGVLERNLWMLPSLKKAEIPALLSACNLATSLFLNKPELQANSPNKFFDALAAGRPVAINNGGWLEAVIRERGCGLVMPPDDPAAAAPLVTAALRDPEWQLRARRQAVATGRALFDRNQLADQLEAVLQKAAGTVSVSASGSDVAQPQRRAA